MPTQINLCLPNICSSNWTKEEIVDLVIKEEKKSILNEIERIEESYWDNLKESYLQFEQIIQHSPYQIPHWEVAGPVHYGMSLIEMKERITKVFQEMIDNQRILTETSVENRRYAFYPTWKRGDDNLTRLWGANFLEKQFRTNDSLLCVPKHYLIIEDPEKDVEVRIFLQSHYPVLNGIKNGYILSEKVEGEPKASRYQSSEVLAECGFRDLSDEGNILVDEKGIGWVVDTEIKSFHPMKPSLFHQYLDRRFNLINNTTSQVFISFKFSLNLNTIN